MTEQDTNAMTRLAELLRRANESGQNASLALAPNETCLSADW